jgi:hypothetical protein
MKLDCLFCLILEIFIIIIIIIIIISHRFRTNSFKSNFRIGIQSKILSKLE